MKKAITPFFEIFIATACALAVGLSASLRAGNPPHWKFAPTPPMGWNSYDAFGSSVTESEFLANADYVQKRLLKHGYDIVVVDFRWADATAADYDPNGIGGPLTVDKFGRLLPAPNRFPSAVQGRGFKPLADRVHAMGLKFGIHVMRGIPRQTVAQNLPIEGSKFRAADAADAKSACEWCADMWGIDATSAAGQDYYDSIFRLYASWGVDYVKVDDLSRPYHKPEIEAVRKAIDRCGRPMILSTSPGETPPGEARHIAANANLWRISADFWDRWADLDKAFDLASAWQASGVGGPGRWPDGDMIPLGRIAIRSQVDQDRWTRLTRDEQIALLSLFALMPSPLMLGMNLPDNDAWTLGLLTNDEMLAINQDPLGQPGRRIRQERGTEIWIRDLADGSKAVGLFNRGNSSRSLRLTAVALGISGIWTLRDVWRREDEPPFRKSRKWIVPAHGAVLLRLSPRR